METLFRERITNGKKSIQQSKPCYERTFREVGEKYFTCKKRRKNSWHFALKSASFNFGRRKKPSVRILKEKGIKIYKDFYG
jgi:hypothetical protein